METIIHLHNRPVRVKVSKKARLAENSIGGPLLAEINLIFGCMLAKRVWFKDDVPKKAVQITDKLYTIFHTVRYAKTCSFDAIDNGAEASDYPLVADIKHFVPDWLDIDFHRGEWRGTFGFSRELALELGEDNSIAISSDKAGLTATS
ncbi:MAG: hypothetical protein BMS9Abin36_2196 [Gammaproteobacteria bacterium]|nr:MAG: hypothetical protein BMS9Abin36_2196 [Gammaproteobacteria bacterium]